MVSVLEHKIAELGSIDKLRINFVCNFANKERFIDKLVKRLECSDIQTFSARDDAARLLFKLLLRKSLTIK